MIQTVLCSRISGQLYVSERKWNDPSHALNAWERRWDNMSPAQLQFNREHPQPDRDEAGWYRDAFRPKVLADEPYLDKTFEGWRSLRYGEFMDTRGPCNTSSDC